ncbi:hypothetical protein VCRA2114E123_30069 [Vibrio crassostreae]|nr:hypothetical protein VCRA2114E123_30069 [Vibrio crassostreae]CAK2031188.1 hypothetical protein VCRA2114E122_30069 [Vibrio crassostreae]CAK3574513.1 hypothetical protein VCRA2126O133_30268 [Vibrio crassostreae]
MFWLKLILGQNLLTISERWTYFWSRLAKVNQSINYQVVANLTHSLQVTWFYGYLDGWVAC